MSLINKMLQDLETRKNTQADSASNKSVYNDLKPIRAAGARAPSRRLTSLLVLIALAGGGAYAWTQWGDTLLSTVISRDETAKPRPVAVRRPAPKPAPVAPTAAPAPAPVAMNEPPANPPAAPTAKAEDKPAMATTSHTENTDAKAMAAPVPVTPTPAPGPQGASSAAARNGYWVVSRGDTLYAISEKTGIDLWDLSRWNRLGREHLIYPGQRLRLTPPTSTVAKPAKTPLAQNQSTAMKPAVTTPPVSDGMEAGSGVVDKRLRPPSTDQKAEGEYREAVSLLQKGRADDAAKHLRAALAVSADHTGARELLAGLELQRGRWHEAQQLLEQGIEKAPSYYPFALLLARVYVEHGSERKALGVMEAGRQAGAADADFMGFLAALYQRAGKHAEAVQAYTEAIKLNPAEGRSWLGMAISLEAGQDWRPAGEAYQRAIDTGRLDDGLLKYARQRLAIVRNK